MVLWFLEFPFVTCCMIGICNFISLAVYNAGGLFGGRFSLYITLSLAVYNAGSGHSRCL